VSACTVLYYNTIQYNTILRAAGCRAAGCGCSCAVDPHLCDDAVTGSHEVWHVGHKPFHLRRGEQRMRGMLDTNPFTCAGENRE